MAKLENIVIVNDFDYVNGGAAKVAVNTAEILANKGMDVIDCGVPLLSMHSPYEVTSKFDIYSAYKTYKAFWEEA